MSHLRCVVVELPSGAVNTWEGWGDLGPPDAGGKYMEPEALWLYYCELCEARGNCMILRLNDDERLAMPGPDEYVVDMVSGVRRAPGRTGAIPGVVAIHRTRARAPLPVLV